MDALRDSVRTIVRGALFLVPIVLLIILFAQAIKFIARLLAPVGRLVPTETVAGMIVVDLLAVAAIVGICLLAGVLARTAIIGSIGDRIEQVLLRRIPGFTLVKGMTEGIFGIDTGSAVKVALAWIEESWALAFIMERHENGLSTVFVPSAPTPAAGAIYYLPDDRLRLLDVPVSAAIACVTSLGIGSRQLLATAKLTPPPEVAAQR